MLPPDWAAGPSVPEQRRHDVLRRVTVATFTLALGVAVVGSSYLVDRSRTKFPLPRSLAKPSSPGAAPSPTPAPSATPSIQAEVVGSFPGSVSGARLGITIDRLYPDKDCLTDAFPDVLAGAGGYYSECKSWKDAGFDLYFFYAIVENRTASDVPFALNDIDILSTEGRTFKPIQTGDFVSDPIDYVPDEETIHAHGVVQGWLTFSSFVDFVPARLIYQDDRQALVIEFHGRHTRLPRTHS